MNRLHIFIITLLLITVWTSPGLAQAEPGNETLEERIQERKQELEEIEQNQDLIKERRNRPLKDKIFVRGQQMEFDVSPIIHEERTLIPVRKVTETLDATVEWIDEENKVIIQRDGNTIEMVLGETEVLVNGESHQLEIPGQKINSRTLVPLRFISKILGDSVDYDHDTGEIDIGLIKETRDTRREENPLEVVTDYWEKYQSGEQSIDGIELELDELTEEEQLVKDEFQLEAVDYQVENDTAIVDVDFTKPNFEEVINRFSEEGTEEIMELMEQGASEEELIEKTDELMIEFILDAERITLHEQAELTLINGEWQIEEWNFENLEERWSTY